MTIGRPRWLAVAASVAVIAAVAGITLGVTTLLGVTFQGEGSAQQGGGRQFVSNLMRTANRDKLAICVQAVGFDGAGPAPDVAGQTEALAKPRIEQALAEARKHPLWESQGGSGPLPPVVDIGCPSGPAPTWPADPRPIEDIVGRGVEEAGYYAIFVFILPDEDLARLLGGSTIRTANQESICIEGDMCYPVSHAAYLKPGDLQAPPFLANLLERVLGLEPWR